MLQFSGVGPILFPFRKAGGRTRWGFQASREPPAPGRGWANWV